MLDYKTVFGLVVAAADLWPAFSVYERRRRPLKIGIHKDIEATGVLTPGEISALLRLYCGNYGYLRACREGVDRIGLDGSPAGVVTAGEAANCAQRLQAYRAANGKTPPIPNRAAPVAPTASKANGKAAAPPTRPTPPTPPAPTPQPKRLGLSDLKRAWLERQRAAMGA